MHICQHFPEASVSEWVDVLLQPANRTHNPQLHTIPTNWKPKHQIRQAATTCIIISSSWWWAWCCPKHVEQAIRSAIKIHLLHLVGILFPHRDELSVSIKCGELLDRLGNYQLIAVNCASLKPCTLLFLTACDQSVSIIPLKIASNIRASERYSNREIRLLRNRWILPEFPDSVYLSNVSENSVFCITFHSQLYSQRGNKKESFVLAGADTWRHLIILPDIHIECLSTLSFRSIVRSNNGAFGDVGAMHHCIQFTYNFFYLLSSLQCETRTKLW